MNRRRFLAQISSAVPASLLLDRMSLAQTDGPKRLLIGTYGDNSRGIWAANFDSGTGKLTEPLLVAEATKPSFLAIPAKDRTRLYTVTATETDSAANSYRLSPGTGDGALAALGSTAGHGIDGCHVSTTADGTSVFIACYGSGSIASFQADGKGILKLASAISFPKDKHGPMTDRQEASHAHGVYVTPDGGYLLVNDLGLDCIHVFHLDNATAKLTPAETPEWKARAGSGPRHLTFHPNGKWLYSINELDNTVDHLSWDASEGALTAVSRISTLPSGIDPAGKNACEVVLSKDAKFLYASNRFYEDFAVFSVNPSTGTLNLVQHQPNAGKESRHIAIDPSGKWFLTANQSSNDITVYPRDANTGKLGRMASQVKLLAPSCLLFG